MIANKCPSQSVQQTRKIRVGGGGRGTAGGGGGGGGLIVKKQNFVRFA